MCFALLLVYLSCFVVGMLVLLCCECVLLSCGYVCFALLWVCLFCIHAFHLLLLNQFRFSGFFFLLLLFFFYKRIRQIEEGVEVGGAFSGFVQITQH